MKKAFLIVTALLGLSLAAVAQPKAVGLRGGLFGNEFSGEISYEHWFTIFDNDYDFLEAELGVFGSNGFKGTLIYNLTLVHPEFTDRGDWGLYVGPGVVTGYGTGFTNKQETKSFAFFGLAAQLGMEYTFWFPLQVSVDFRPSFMIPAWMNRSELGKNANRWCHFAFGVRYAF